MPRKIDEQIDAVRRFLDVSNLTILKKNDLAVSFRGSASGLNELNTMKANIMVQIAVNKALKIDAPAFNNAEFEDSIEYASTLITEHKNSIH